MRLYMDTETYSSVNLFTAGTHAYAEAPDAEVMLWCWARDDDEVQCWDRTADPVMPLDLEEALELADEHVWQNAHFDLTLIRETMGMELPLHKTWDTMVQALMHGLPGGLDKLCEIMQVSVDEAKHKRGKQLIQWFCKPRPATSALRRWTRHTHPDLWAEFIEYAKSDIRAMRVMRKRLPVWNLRANQNEELDLWRIDQEINNAGVFMDLELADAALKAVADNKKVLDAQVEEWTGGDVQSANQRDALLGYILKEHGIELPDMKAATLETRAKDENLPQAVRDLLLARMERATASTAKYRKLRQVVSHDGYARGLIQFSGAGRTQRDAGRLWQPQNLPRPIFSNAEIEEGIKLLKLDPELVEMAWGVSKMASSALRGSIIAPPGKKIVVSDLKNIEGVTGAWLAGEQWKVDAYRAQFLDATLPDMYRLAYGRSFGVDPMSITKAQRQLGKIQELALAYEGGVGAFVTFVLTYRMDLAQVAAAVLPTLSPETYEKALGMYEWRLRKKLTTYGLDREVFIACEALKLLWRAAHPEISGYWKELQAAAENAILNPGVDFEVRRLTFRRDGAWLRMIKPSGKCVCYPNAEIHNSKIRYRGINPYKHQWGWISTYGGKIFENADQSVSRDVLFNALRPAREAGYDVRLRVHDEFITYAPDSPEFTAEGLSDILATVPWWAPGLPLAADGFEGYRYRKDD